MAYDYSSKKMYAISIYSDGEVSALYTVDLNTAVSTPARVLLRHKRKGAQQHGESEARHLAKC